MFKIELEPSNEKILVDHLRLMILDNPTILNTIIEPTVNELISDANVPQAIKEKINAGFIELGTRNLFTNGVKDFLAELFENEYGDQFIEDKITSYFTENEEMKHLIDAKIDHAINENNIDTLVETAIDEHINGLSIEDGISEAIDEKIEEHVNLRDDTFRRMVDDSLTGLFEEDPFIEQIQRSIDEKLTDMVQAKLDATNVNNLVSNRVTELLTADLIKTVIDKYLVDNHVVDQVKKTCIDEKKNVPADLLNSLEIKVRGPTQLIVSLMNMLNKEIFTVKQVGME